MNTLFIFEAFLQTKGSNPGTGSTEKTSEVEGKISDNWEVKEVMNPVSFIKVEGIEGMFLEVVNFKVNIFAPSVLVI